MTMNENKPQGTAVEIRVERPEWCNTIRYQMPAPKADPAGEHADTDTE